MTTFSDCLTKKMEISFQSSIVCPYDENLWTDLRVWVVMISIGMNSLFIKERQMSESFKTVIVLLIL